MISALYGIQKAIYDRILADATIMARIEGVFDSPEIDQAYPYITIGECTSVPWRTHSKPGEEVTVTLHIWSVYEGFKEALEILGDLNRLFGDKDLTVSGWDCCHSWFDFSDTIREPEGVVRHVVARYRIRGFEI